MELGVSFLGTLGGDGVDFCFDFLLPAWGFLFEGLPLRGVLTLRALPVFSDPFLMPFSPPSAAPLFLLNRVSKERRCPLSFSSDSFRPLKTFLGTVLAPFFVIFPMAFLSQLLPALIPKDLILLLSGRWSISTFSDNLFGFIFLDSFSRFFSATFTGRIALSSPLSSAISSTIFSTFLSSFLSANVSENA